MSKWNEIWHIILLLAFFVCSYFWLNVMIDCEQNIANMLVHGYAQTECKDID